MHHCDHVQFLVCCIHQCVDQPIDLSLREYGRDEWVCVAELTVVVVEWIQKYQAERTHEFVRLDVHISISPVLFGIAPNRLMEVLHRCTHAAEIVGIGYARNIMVSFQVDVRRMVDIGCLYNT